MNRVITIVIALLTAAAALSQPAARRDVALSMSLIPNAFLPLPDENDLFEAGGGVDLAVDLPLPFLQSVALRGEAGYTYLPIWSGDAVNFASVAGGASMAGPFRSGRLGSEFFASAGYAYGVVADEENSAGGNALIAGGVRLGYRATPRTDIGFELRYESNLDGLGGTLYHGVGFGISTRYNVLRRRKLEIDEVRFDDVFPVLYKRYTERGFGTATISNGGATPVEGLAVSLFVEGYMDTPWECPAPETLDGGETIEVDLRALFSERSVLGITESTLVPGTVTVTYRQDNRDYSIERAQSIRIHDRHAITWDDDRKAAAYVTYKDPAIVAISSTLSEVAESRSDVVDRNFRTAVALHEALRSYGLTYRVDPTTPFIEFSQDAGVVDYLQFPRNTLARKAGDCDDLSILYAAALESVGIESAFLTIPGHIYVAFALSMPPEWARNHFAAEADVIVANGRAWIPVEITLVDAPFVEAWKTGAAQWSANRDEAAIIPLHEAWSEYEPVGQVGDFDPADFVEDDVIGAAFATELERFVARELAAQTATYERRLASRGDDPRVLNRLGTVHARYGRSNDARDYFERAIAADPFVPALVNLGNMLFLQGRYEEAAERYAAALEERPNEPAALLQMSRVYNRLGDFAASGEYYAELKALEPDIAERYSYLDIGRPAAERAASRQRGSEEIVWLDE